MKNLFLFLICLPFFSIAQITGCISGDCENGYGTYVWKSGTKYIGEWKNGEMNGLGKMLWESGNQYYGEWVNGQEEGAGRFIHKNGSIYLGGWKDGKEHFWGGIKYAKSGRLEFGMFRDGQLNGAGWLVGTDANQIGVYSDGEAEQWYNADNIDWNE